METLKLLNWEIYPEKGETLLQAKLDKPSDMQYFAPALGDWEIKDGALQGVYRGNNGGICFSREAYPGNILLDFYASMIPPCSNDLNFAFRSGGWDYENNTVEGFIGGLNGWYDDRAGLEKYPPATGAVADERQRQMEITDRALVGFTAVSGQAYHIQAGYVEDTAFFFVDGQLVVEMLDAKPEQTQNLGYFGLGLYCSQVRFWNLRASRPCFQPAKNRVYVPNF